MFSSLSDALIQRARNIKLLILDVDGVLTNAQLLMTSNGEIIKAFNTLDGHGIKMLQSTGVQTAIITARNDAAVAHRAEQLGITHYLHGASDKREAFMQLCQSTNIAATECAMLGDDVIDLPIMACCGLPLAVANAHDFVQQHAAYVTKKSGGLGAVREVCDLLMAAQDTFNTVYSEYLRYFSTQNNT